jgi:hypothetical protein
LFKLIKSIISNIQKKGFKFLIIPRIRNRLIENERKKERKRERERRKYPPNNCNNTKTKNGIE